MSPMLFSRSKTSVPSSSTNRLPGNFSPSRFGYVVECTQVQPITAPLNCKVSLVACVPSLKSVSSFEGLHSCKALHVNFNLEDPLHVSGLCEQKLCTNHSKKQTLARDNIFDSWSDSENTSGVDHAEIQRGRRINGHGNKGNVPWNKGIKHCAETRKLISQRTVEALSDPKVRKRMSGPRRPRSNQTKARIGASQRRLWEERLKLKRLREEYYLLWADNIAKAAKKGGLDQETLEWDCYERLKREIVSKQLKQQAAAKAKRAKRKARAEAERMARLTQKRKDQEERAKLSGEVKRRCKRSPEEKEELAAARELRLKERLSKIVKKKKINGLVGGQNPRSWQTLDLNFVKKGRKLFGNSLADQTRAIKSKHAESANMAILSASCAVYPSSERAPE